MNSYEMEQLKDDMRSDMLRDARHEELMRNDYDYFLESIDDDLCDLMDAIRVVKDKHQAFGWELNIEELV